MSLFLILTATEELCSIIVPILPLEETEVCLEGLYKFTQLLGAEWGCEYK